LYALTVTFTVAPLTLVILTPVTLAGLATVGALAFSVTTTGTITFPASNLSVASAETVMLATPAATAVTVPSAATVATAVRVPFAYYDGG
jgi:hypothetical protein